jgi:hypothetical protein
MSVKLLIMRFAAIKQMDNVPRHGRPTVRPVC